MIEYFTHSDLIFLRLFNFETKIINFVRIVNIVVEKLFQPLPPRTPPPPHTHAPPLAVRGGQIRGRHFRGRQQRGLHRAVETRLPGETLHRARIRV